MDRSTDTAPGGTTGFAQPVRALRARLFRISSATLLAALLASTAFFALRLAWTTALILAASAAVTGGSILLAARGASRTARRVLTVTMLVTQATLMLAGNGIHDIVLTATGGILIIASLLLRRRAFIAYVIATLLTLGGIAVAEMVGLLNNEFSEASDAGTLFVPGSTRQQLAVGERAVKQGFLEESNVNTVSTMVDMISVQRAYANAAKALTTLDGIRATISNDLGKVPG